MEHNIEDPIPLKEGVSIKSLISGEGTIFEVNYDEVHGIEESIQRSYGPREVFNHTNSVCLNFMDDVSYGDGECEPFEVLANKMTNIINDGKVKKEVLKEGRESIKPECVQYSIHYNAYTEYNDEPFDSSYIRKKPFRFMPNKGETLPGLEIAVESMKLNEKARFLVSSDLAYGDLGCLERIGPKATILYEIELLNWINVFTDKTDSFSSEGPKEFRDVYKHCLAVCDKGNELYKKAMYKQATREYNYAISNLEYAVLRDFDDQERQQKLLLRLLSNLAVTYTKLQEPKRACTTCNRIYQMCKGTSLKPSAKVHFNHARSLMQLDDYVWAERQLKQAQRLQPQNPEIVEEFRKLDIKKKESYDREVKLAKTIFQHNQIVKDPCNEDDEVSDEFRQVIASLCEDLKTEPELSRYTLGNNLTANEKQFASKEANRYGLLLVTNNNNVCFIAKNMQD